MHNNSPNRANSGGALLREALAVRRETCDEYGEHFENSPESRSADCLHDRSANCLHDDDLSSLGESPQRTVSRPLQPAEPNFTGVEHDTVAVAHQPVSNGNAASHNAAGSMFVEARNSESPSVTSFAKDPLHQWTNRLENVFGSTPSSQSRERLRFPPRKEHSIKQPASKHVEAEAACSSTHPGPMQRQRISHANGVQIQRFSDYGGSTSSWDLSVTLDGEMSRNPEMTPASTSASSWEGFLTFSSESVPQVERNSHRQSPAVEAHQALTEESEKKHSSSKLRRTSPHKHKPSLHTDQDRRESKSHGRDRRRSSGSPSLARRRQQHHRFCGCNALDAILGD